MLSGLRVITGPSDLRRNAWGHHCLPAACLCHALPSTPLCKRSSQDASEAPTLQRPLLSDGVWLTHSQTFYNAAQSAPPSTPVMQVSSPSSKDDFRACGAQSGVPPRHILTRYTINLGCGASTCLSKHAKLSASKANARQQLGQLPGRSLNNACRLLGDFPDLGLCALSTVVTARPALVRDASHALICTSTLPLMSVTIMGASLFADCLPH